MPLSHHSHTLTGGCNCQAVRYQISVPPFSERLTTPYRTPSADVGDATIPAIYVCHCNDCRAATAAIPGMAIVTEMKHVKVSLVPRLQVLEDQGGSIPASALGTREAFRPAAEVFRGDQAPGERTYLQLYKSSPKRSRWFCGRCGTPIGYTVDDGVIPAEWGWPDMLDLWLGTVDRGMLEKEEMRPERMLWCEKGVPWVRRWAREGAGEGVPEHPLTRIDVIWKEEE